jgi:hypothetical protein
MRRTFAAAALSMLAACGDSGTAPGPGGVSVDEAEALDQAAEMLDSQRLPPGALEEPATGSSPDGAP